MNERDREAIEKADAAIEKYNLMAIENSEKRDFYFGLASEALRQKRVILNRIGVDEL